MTGRIFLGRYITIRLLGKGGMGLVYLAHQTDLGRDVVVKVMHDEIAQEPKFRERFEREMLLTARFQHPYAVTVFDASLVDPNGPCIVMEYIKGVTLDSLLGNNHRLDPVRVGRLLDMICEVLYSAHEKGIVHRDLKPANLMIVDPGTPYELVKVMDFGLAKPLTPEPNAILSQTEFVVGTPGYMSPEQARGEEVDHRGDLYSVGVILFEMLTGQLPFSGGNTMDLLLAHATQDPPSFSSVGAVGVVPAPIERVVQGCLAKSPEHRPSDARELARRYREALACVQLDQKQSKSSNGSWYPSPKPVVRQTPTTRPVTGDAGGSIPIPPVVSVLNEPLASPLSTVGTNESVVIKTHTPLPIPEPHALTRTIEAWMPENIATFKMRGFIQDKGGELIESVSGRLTVRFSGNNCVYQPPPVGWGGFLWYSRPSLLMELRLMRTDVGGENVLKVTIVFRSSSGVDLNIDPIWRDLCSQIFIDLRGYLMGKNAT